MVDAGVASGKKAPKKGKRASWRFVEDFDDGKARSRPTLEPSPALRAALSLPKGGEGKSAKRGKI